MQWCVDHAGSRWSAGADEQRNDDGDEDSGTGHGGPDFGSIFPSSRWVQGPSASVRHLDLHCSIVFPTLIPVFIMSYFNEKETLMYLCSQPRKAAIVHSEFTILINCQKVSQTFCYLLNASNCKLVGTR